MQLRDRYYVKCIIHMDGAKYHKSRVNPSPASNARKSVLQEWLRNQNITFDEHATKSELADIIKRNKGCVQFKCVEIAKTYGHEVLYTPPYHCELQPMEGIWAVVKNELGTRGHDNIADLHTDILNMFHQKVKRKTILGLWKRSLRRASEYHDAEEKEQILSTMESDDSDDDDGEEDVEEEEEEEAESFSDEEESFSEEEYRA